MSRFPIAGAMAFLNEDLESRQNGSSSDMPALEFTGPFEARSPFPRGGTFWPLLNAEDGNPDESFTPRIANEFENAIREGQHVSKKLLTSIRRANYRYWLHYPTMASQITDPRERQREINAKHYCLTHFELVRDQVYRSAEEEKRPSDEDSILRLHMGRRRYHQTRPYQAASCE
jgi:hypothetical protein